MSQTKRIKEALPKHIIMGHILNPSRDLTDRALAKAAGKTVVKAQLASVAYASYNVKVGSACPRSLSTEVPRKQDGGTLDMSL